MNFFQVLYCLRHYKGDEKIRNFIWDLIEPCENGEVTISRNHSGLHNPVPRGRNAKKKNRPKDIPKPNDLQKWEDSGHWSSIEKYDCEAYLESSYKKHLFRHANKLVTTWNSLISRNLKIFLISRIEIY